MSPSSTGKRCGVGCIPAPSWDFAVLDASQFVVLLPQIGFDDFGCGQEPENGHVPLGETVTPSSANAGNPVATSPAPIAPPTASPLSKKARRLVAAFVRCTLSSMIFSFCVCCAICSMIFSNHG